MTPEPLVTIGWDVGGVQVKAARVESRAGRPRVVRTAVRASRDLAANGTSSRTSSGSWPGELSVDAAAAHALTMTAELSDAFRDKREGVLFVMDGLDAAFPRSAVFAFDSDGVFVPLPEARARPLAFAATNWIASALYAAPRIDECILVDVGSTTTDIVPIRERSPRLRRTHGPRPAHRRRAGVHRRPAHQSQHPDEPRCRSAAAPAGSRPSSSR